MQNVNECDVPWQKALDEKLAAIEQNKLNLIAAVKQTSAKLKFTLNGSVARDHDYLMTFLQSSRERLTSLSSATDEALRVLNVTSSECPDINVCQLCYVVIVVAVVVVVFVLVLVLLVFN